MWHGLGFMFLTVPLDARFLSGFLFSIQPSSLASDDGSLAFFVGLVLKPVFLRGDLALVRLVRDVWSSVLSEA